MAMFRKVEEESRGLKLCSFSDLDCSLSNWMGTVAGSNNTLFWHCSFLCHHNWYARRALVPKEHCILGLFVWFAEFITEHRSCALGRLEKTWERHCCVYSHFFHHFEVSEFGCITGSYFYLCVFFFLNGEGSLLLRIFGLHLIFLSGSFASIIGLCSDKSYFIWKDFIHSTIYC